MIVSSRIRDNQAVDEPSGVVRAYDPKTGAVCTENAIRVDDVTESPKLAE